MKQSLVILISAVAVSGCAGFVQTQKIDTAEITSGISYYLPKRMFDVTVTVKDIGFLKQQGEYTEAMTLSAALKAEAAKLKGEWDKLKLEANNTPTGDAKVDAVKVAQTAEGKYKAAKISADSAKSNMENLKRKYDLAISTPSGQCNYNISMKVSQQPLEPDTRHPLTLKMNHSWLRDDELTVKTTSSGLLSSLDVTTTDRTGDIAVEIAKIAAMVVTGIPLPAAPAAPRRAKPKICFPTELQYSEVIDFADKGKVFDISLRDSIGDKPDPTKYLLPPSLRISINIPNGGGVNLGDPLSKMCIGDSKTSEKCDRPGGFLYRRDETFLVQLQRAEEPYFVLASTQISMPNLSPVSAIPIDALRFVKTTNKTVFENGMLVSYDTSLPSQALEAAKIPTNILAALTGAIANIIQGKFTIIKNQTELADQKNKLNEALKKP